MFVVAMAQVLMAFSFSALVVSIGGVVASFDAPATRVGTAIVVYSLTVAAFIMLGAKIGERLGAKRVFLASVALFGAAMGLVAVSPTVSVLIAAQGLAGLAAAALVPTLVVLIASHYEGRQRAQALGWLGPPRPWRVSSRSWSPASWGRGRRGALVRPARGAGGRDAPHELRARVRRTPAHAHRRWGVSSPRAP